MGCEAENKPDFQLFGEHNRDPLILIQVDTELLKFITLCLEANHI
jgi:hypothetical protein